MPTTPILNLQNLAVLNRLAEISFSAESGEILGILGQNGAGKSTLLKTIAGVCDFSGAIFLEGKSFKKISPPKRAQQIAMIFQNQNAFWDLKVLEIVRLGRLPWNDENESAVFNALKIAELEDFKNRRISTLSGGEAARVFLARALANTPKILLADEITANLDPLYQKKIAEILKNFARENNGTVLMALHDIAFAAEICEKILCLKKGKIVAFGKSSEILTAKVLSEVFNTAMPDFSKK